eukprot:1355366-Pleurochrysis_carterae.AAC.4
MSSSTASNAWDMTGRCTLVSFVISSHFQIPRFASFEPALSARRVHPRALTQAMKMGSEVYHHLKLGIKKKYGQDACNVGDEGGFAPNIVEATEGLDLIVGAIEAAGYTGARHARTHTHAPQAHAHAHTHAHTHTHTHTHTHARTHARAHARAYEHARANSRTRTRAPTRTRTHAPTRTHTHALVGRPVCGRTPARAP